jgi:hypothetical protein
LQRIETLGDEFDYAGIIQIVPECVVESFQEFGVLRIAVGGFEIGNGKANFIYAQAGAGANPILCR